MIPARSSKVLWTILLLTAIWCYGLWAANVKVLDQELNLNGQGYTVLRVWGSYYEMGYAHASILGDYIVEAVNQTKARLGSNYTATRSLIASSVWLPMENEAELDGIVASLGITHSAANIDALDLKVFNTLGDWAYACRSHTCWGRYVEPPIKTLSTRRLDFSTAVPILNHHVLIAYDPNDGSPEWLNLAWPGIVTVAQGINEYGTLVSLHDYKSFPADLSPGGMSRLAATRYALTLVSSDDVSTHLDQVFAELQKYEIMTGTFVNYYAPLGYGGVMNCSPFERGPDFYRLRTPQEAWHHGEAMVTTNEDTDGTYTPSDEDVGVDAYYDDESPKTHESHWYLVDPVAGNHGLSRLSVAYRGPRDMTIWADGRLDGIGRTPRLEYEWFELFDSPAKYSGGSGTAEDPYQIAATEDLILLGESPDDYDKHFVLTADIDLDPNLPGRKVFDRAVIAPVMIAIFDYPLESENAFTGAFDGNGHIISNLTIEGVFNLGLFGLTQGATICDIGLEAVDVMGGHHVASLVGLNNGSITSSYCTGTVTGVVFVGGLVGNNFSGCITASYNTGTVHGQGTYIGGLVGANDANIVRSYNVGKVYGSGDDVGGIAGVNGGNITASYNTGAVTGQDEVGGLAGAHCASIHYPGSITASYSTGDVSGNNKVGGLVGYNWGSDISAGYSTGMVTGPNDVGGLVGYNHQDRIISAVTSFWDVDTSDHATSAGGIGLTTAEMQTANTFLDAGWDLVNETTNGTDDIWWINEGQDYPRLWWELMTEN